MSLDSMFQAAVRKPVKFKTKAEQEKTKRQTDEALAASRRMAKIRAVPVPQRGIDHGEEA